MQLFNVFNWWIFIVITCSQEAFSLFQLLERDLFDDSRDHSIFSDEASLEEVIPLDQTAWLNSDSLLADGVLDPLRESDSDWFLANDDYVDESDPTSLLADNTFACDVDSIDNTQLPGKVRRDNLCRDPPVGQVENPDESSQENPFDALTKFVTDTSPLAIFPKELEICPVEKFGTSNIPVCKDELQGDMKSIPLSNAVNLYFIDPVLFFPIVACRNGGTLFCCRQVFYNSRPRPLDLEDDEFDNPTEEPLEMLRQRLSLARYRYGAMHCYRQAFPPSQP